MQINEVGEKSALYVAAENNSKSRRTGLEAIAKWVGIGEVLDLRDNKGLMPIMCACQNGNAPSVRTLVGKRVGVASEREMGVVSVMHVI